MSHNYLELPNIRWSRINLIAWACPNFLKILLIVQDKFWSCSQPYVVRLYAICMREINLLSTKN